MGAAANIDGLIHQIELAESRDQLRDPLHQLAILAAEGSQPACDGLLAAIDHHQLALPAIKRQLFNTEDQADVAQDALVAVAHSIASFRGEANVLTWLHSVATNCAMAFLRRKQEHGDLTTVEASWGARFTSIASNQLVVREAIDQLPDAYRAAVMLRDIEQLSYVEIAARLDLNLNTARAHIARGRALVSASLGGSIAGLDEIDGGGD